MGVLSLPSTDRRDCRVDLYERVTTQDSFGAERDAYRYVDYEWVSFKQLHGEELATMQQVIPRATHRAHMMHRDDLEHDWRIKLDDRWFEIASIENIRERDGHTVLVLIEKVD